MRGSPMSRDPDARPARFLRLATREARAFAKLASLLPRDWASSTPSHALPGDDVVVLVHGTLATAGAWRPLRRKLAKLEGTHTAVFTYGPSSGVCRVAAMISSIVERLPPLVRIHLVGHSLGGLAVRWFVQETPSDARVVQTISVAAPFSGARGARFFPGPAGRDMRAGSAILRRLAVTAGVSDLPHLSILGSADTAVPYGTAFPVGEQALVQDAGHNGLLFDEAVASRIIERILAVKSEATLAGKPKR
jgi:pimeloyl-ACP methyl ester carboxylesterase